MKKLLIGICAIILLGLLAKHSFARDKESIKAEIRHHKNIIRKLEKELKGNEDANGEVGSKTSLPDNASVDRPWEKAADTNNDGVVGQAEIKQWNNGKKSKGKVDTPWENKANLDDDGIIEKSEKAMWDKKHNKSKSQVDKPWESKADANKDGRVDKTEKKYWDHRKKK